MPSEVEFSSDFTDCNGQNCTDSGLNSLRNMFHMALCLILPVLSAQQSVKRCWHQHELYLASQPVPSLAFHALHSRATRVYPTLDHARGRGASRNLACRQLLGVTLLFVVAHDTASVFIINEYASSLNRLSLAQAIAANPNSHTILNIAAAHILVMVWILI